MNRLKERLYPITIITMGVYLVIFGFYLNRYVAFPFIEFAQILIIVGIFLFGFQEIKTRLSNIENDLEIDGANKVSNAKFISKDISNDFIGEIKRKKYVYKASIYLPSSSMDNLFLIQNLLSNTKFDSKIRLLINTYDEGDVEKNNLDSLIRKKQSKIELNTIKNKENNHFSILIIDTDVWVILDFGNSINGNLLFSISSYNQQGKSFIELFNNLWQESKPYSINQG